MSKSSFDENMTSMLGTLIAAGAILAVTILLWGWLGLPFPGRYVVDNSIRLDTWTGAAKNITGQDLYIRRDN